MCACSSPLGTEEPCSADTGGLWLQVYTGHIQHSVEGASFDNM